MPDTLVGTVIHIDEQRFPIGSQCIIIYRITVVLTGNETTFRSYHAHRLVMAAMTVFQFIDGSASCFGKQLIPHTNAEDRLVAQAHRLADMLYRLIMAGNGPEFLSPTPVPAGA